MNLIPAPYEFKQGVGYYKLSDDPKIKSEFDLLLVKLTKSDKADILIKKADLPDEAYTLDVSKGGIEITAGSEIGAYYALQSLRQLSGAELGESSVPICSIYDKPRFSWRGLQLDESRHFFGKDVVKKLLDMMFMMKLNVFHWHLSDDQGWRIQIDKYPKLTEIGSKRKYTQIGGWQSKEILFEKHEGFYTKAEIAEIVSYAKERGIMVVPEIDFPAHSASAIAAYPWLACREIETEVPGYFGSIIPERVEHNRKWNRTICLGKEKVLQFVFDVIDEVCELFPAPYFHIGGDEAPTNEWKKCPCCQKTIKDNVLKNEKELQGWFNNLVLEHLRSKGKRLIGWNEILEAGNLDKSVIAQYWTPQRDRNAERHVNSGGNIIMSKHQSFYFDMPYAQYPLKNTYCHSLQSYGVMPENIKNVLGVEGENWTEWTADSEKLELNLYPRVQALSEVAWSRPEIINWQDFLSRLDKFTPYFELFNTNYASLDVAMQKSKIKRAKIQKLFYKGDPYYEVKLNNMLKQKGEK